jgi:hypothetical protein
MILCLSVAGKETEGPPIFSRFLLHDSSDRSIGGVSGERKLSIFGQDVGVAPPLLGGALIAEKPPERWRSIAKSWLPLSGDQSKVLELEHSWEKNSGKSLPSQGNLAAV